MNGTKQEGRTEALGELQSEGSYSWKRCVFQFFYCHLRKELKDTPSTFLFCESTPSEIKKQDATFVLYQSSLENCIKKAVLAAYNSFFFRWFRRPFLHLRDDYHLQTGLGNREADDVLNFLSWDCSHPVLFLAVYGSPNHLLPAGIGQSSPAFSEVRWRSQRCRTLARKWRDAFEVVRWGEGLELSKKRLNISLKRPPSLSDAF